MKRGRAWPFAIAGILLAGVGANVGLIVLASSDPSAAIEPDYYRKALAWDAEMAQQQRNIALGWSVHSVLQLGREGADGLLELTLADSSGKPLTGADVTALVMHNARAAAVQSVALRETEKGTYTAQVAAQRPGLWEIRVSVQREAQVFTARERLQAQPPA